ncbi:MAG: vitamin K epoxide reductase family protein [Desulfuromonadales bacterium]|nr:vitamin K epoxide reductase family protein [Desulfuromonadales bacterium]
MDNTVSPGKSSGRLLAILLWISLVSGCVIAVLSLIEEICLAQACRDTLSFTFFGFSLGWVGVAYFGLILMVLALRNRFTPMRLLLSALVFSGIGTEFRLLWIQKFIIGAWCPFCVSIACTLFVAATLLILENLQLSRSREQSGKCFLTWLALMLPMTGIGFVVAWLFVRQLV